MPLYSVFIDLTEAFNTINRKTLWTVFERTGCPRKFVKILQLFHDGMTGQVLTKPFEISNGVKQGCVLAPILFNIFTCMLAHAVQDLESGVSIRYRLDVSLFDLRRLTAKTKSLFDLIQEALFADDCALVTLDYFSQSAAYDCAPVTLDCFSQSAKLFGLIN